MPNLQHIERTHIDDILSAVAEDGACVVHEVLPPASCEGLMADFRPYLDAMEWGKDELGYANEFYGARTKRLHGLFSKSPAMVDVLTHPLFLELAKRLFIDTGLSRDVRLSNTELMVLNGSQDDQAFHTDGGSWQRIQAREDGEILISANCALTDFTATNGATRVVPGSHRWEPDRKPQPEEVCLATMPRGSALIYSGKVIHSGGANHEREERVGLYLGYIVSWLRPIENQLVTNDPADVFKLPEQAQRLLDVVPGGFTVLA